MEPSLLTSIGLVDPYEGEEGPSDLGCLPLSRFFSFSSAVTHAFPWLINGKVGCPMKRGIQICTRPNHEIKTQEHDTSTWLSSDRALNTRSLLSPETWDPFPLSPVCNPYCKPSAGNMSSSNLDVGTFHSNQYKPLCPPSTPSEPDA